MENPRFYGVPPFEVVVVHGGPGAIGEMAPVARHPSLHFGVIEPLQTAKTLEGQVDELRGFLVKHAKLPVVLLGHSWGAWLSYLVAARFPELIRKLILVGSGPFEEKYTAEIERARLARLTEPEGREYRLAIRGLAVPSAGNKDELLIRLAKLSAKSDSFDPMDSALEEEGDYSDQAAIFQGVWSEAAKLRRSGELLALGREIRCPVIALHGKDDPHPVQGVELALLAVLSDFKLILLEKCGHTPWKERQAQAEFYAVIEKECRAG